MSRRSLEPMLGFRLLPQKKGEAMGFICTHDRPFLLSKVAGNFTIHHCNILEADIRIQDGIVTDFYRITYPRNRNPLRLEKNLFQSLKKILNGELNIDQEVFNWEKAHHLIQGEIHSKFRISGTIRPFWPYPCPM